MADTGLYQTQTQKLAIGPQMQQSLQILQAPTLELRQIIQQEIEINPVLEVESPEVSLEETAPEDPDSRDELDVIRREHVEEFDVLFGRSYGHVCEKCRKTFRTETLWASLSRTIGGAVVGGIAWVFWFVSGTTNNVIAALLFAAAVAIFGQRVVRIRNRWFRRSSSGTGRA